MLCYAMLCYAMLCYAMLCYAMLCYYAMLCFLFSPLTLYLCDYSMRNNVGMLCDAMTSAFTGQSHATHRRRVRTTAAVLLFLFFLFFYFLSLIIYHSHTDSSTYLLTYQVFIYTYICNIIYCDLEQPEIHA